MKWVFGALGLFSVLVVGVLLFLVKKGVILRPQPLIKPSLIESDFKPVGQRVFMRLYPQLRDIDFIFLRSSLKPKEHSAFVRDFTAEFELQLKKKLNFSFISSQDFESGPSIFCESPCLVWVTGELDRVQIENGGNRSKKSWLEIRAWTFQGEPQMTDLCLEQARLSDDCLFQVAMKLSEKKRKGLEGRLFFLYQYLDQHFYLFIEDSDYDL
jgi:hypothetical protein